MTDRDYGHLAFGLADRIEANYEKCLALLRCRLDARSDLAIRKAGEHWNIELATCLFAYGIYGNGCAILALYRADIGRQMPAIVRAQFEAVVKQAYCKHFPNKAADFIISEPFRRWMTARGVTLRPELRNGIDIECMEMIRAYPRLLDGVAHAQDLLDGKLSLTDRDKKTIADQLDFKDLPQLMLKLDKLEPGWDTDLYGTIYRIGSEHSHHSVAALREALQGETEATFRFDADQHYEGAPDYLLQSTSYLLGMIGRLDECFADSNAGASEDVLPLFTEYQAITRSLKDAGLLH